MIASPTLLVLGLLLLGIGYLLMRWASARDLKEAAFSAALGTAWTLLWKRQRPGVPEEISSRYEEVRAGQGHLGKAKAMAGIAAGHVAAQVASLAGLVLAGLGLLLGGLGIFWR